MQNLILEFADIVALIYHEGRNVRYLIHREQVEPKFLTLRDRLEKNKYDAWKRLQPLRQKAAKAQSCNEVQLIFERKFGLTLNDMVTLYNYTGWKGSPYGGNAWLPITLRTIELRNLFVLEKQEEAFEMLEQILQSSHNTGKVVDKLKELNDSLEF